jgi:hypothetical protein
MFISGPFARDPRTILVQELSRVYAQDLMRPKLLIATLVLALSGANSGAASMCAAYCMASAPTGSVTVHHHQMESQPSPTSMSHHIHTRHHGTACVECPPKSQNSVNQKSDCASLVQVQALKEVFFSFEASSRSAHIDVPNTPADPLTLAGGGERSIPFDASHTVRNSNPASIPLRI